MEEDENAPLPFLDQVAQANTWKSQNRVISATYTGNPQTGNSHTHSVRHTKCLMHFISENSNDVFFCIELC